MSTKRGTHLVELAHVFAGTPIASEWAKKGAATRRARAAQQELPLPTVAEPTADEHVDLCPRCSDHRLELCPTGARLLDAARIAFAERIKVQASCAPTKGGHHGA